MKKYAIPLKIIRLVIEKFGYMPNLFRVTKKINVIKEAIVPGALVILYRLNKLAMLLNKNIGFFLDYNLFLGINS